MKVYIYDNEEYEEIPYWIWPNTSPITERFFLGHGGRIEERENPPEPPVTVYYSTYLIKKACENNNIWNDVKSLIEDANKWESFILIKEIANDNEELQQVLPTIREVFGSTLVDEVLAESII